MNILLADDQQLVRDGIRLILKQLGDTVTVYEADSYQAVFDAFSLSTKFDLLIIDLNMPDAPPYQSIKSIKNIVPEIPIVVLSSTEDANVIKAVLALGVSGYITKSMSSEVMLGALQLVFSGGIYIPSTLLHFSQSTTQAPVPIDFNFFMGDTQLREVPALTKRQKDVLSLVSIGDSDKEIGNKLHISETTVRTHTATIYKLLNVNNRTQASRVAKEIGMLE